jgi:hypothetical protein
LNKDGARIYTEALFGLLQGAHALQ